MFYTVRAYKILRDQGHDPQQKKTALAFLDYALGRPFSHYNLLSQRPQNPLKKDAETGSGLFAGRVKSGEEPHLITREPLFKDDLLRIGYEDDKGHAVQRVTFPVPKKGRLVLKRGKGGKIVKGAPVFIVDRRENDVRFLINELGVELEKYRSPDVMPVDVELDDKPDGGEDMRYIESKTQDSRGSGAGIYVRDKRRSNHKKHRLPGSALGEKNGELEVYLHRNKPKGRIKGRAGAWLPKLAEKNMSGKAAKNTWWFLPPVVWPLEEECLSANVNSVLALGGRNFVLNMPWQINMFERPESLNIWAGPFCNIANPSHVNFLKDARFSGAIVSPELDEEDFMTLPAKSSLPLGVVISANWPLAISRIVSQDIILDRFFTSPMREAAWVSKRESDYWVFPGWRQDLSKMKPVLLASGYNLFLTMEEPLPKGIILKERPGLWNWHLKLL